MTHAHSARLRFETLTPDHAVLMHPVLADERLYQFMDDTRYDSVEQLEARYRRLAGGSPDPEEVWINFILFVGMSNEPIGFVQATVCPARRSAEVGYVVGAAHWGLGYGTEASRWLLDHLHEVHQVEQAQAQIDRRNLASVALVRRLGFEFVRAVPDGGQDDVYARCVGVLSQ